MILLLHSTLFLNIFRRTNILHLVLTYITTFMLPSCFITYKVILQYNIFDDDIHSPGNKKIFEWMVTSNIFPVTVITDRDAS